MKNLISTTLLICLFFCVAAQNKLRGPIWTFHDSNTTIFGISTGLISTADSVATYGIRAELIGLGLLLPMAPELLHSTDSASHAYEELQPPSELVNGISLSALGTICSCDINGLNVGTVGTAVRNVNGINAAYIMAEAEVVNGLQLTGIGFSSAYKINGVQLLGLTAQAIHLNGIQVTLGFAYAEELTGVQVAGLFNQATAVRGLQLGLINKTKTLRGIQIGLWNINEQRSLPLVNWNFDKSIPTPQPLL